MHVYEFVFLCEFIYIHLNQINISGEAAAYTDCGSCAVI